MLRSTLLILVFSCTCALSALAQKPNRNVEVDTIEDSNYILYDQLGDSIYRAIENREVPADKRTIKTEKEALQIGKGILEKEFGAEFNLKSRRYLVHSVKGYWIVKALQPVGFTGGTLIVVFDSESGEPIAPFVWK